MASRVFPRIVRAGRKPGPKGGAPTAGMRPDVGNEADGGEPAFFGGHERAEDRVFGDENVGGNGVDRIERIDRIVRRRRGDELIAIVAQHFDGVLRLPVAQEVVLGK